MYCSMQTSLLQILTFFRAVWITFPSVPIGPASIVPTIPTLCPSIVGPPVGLVDSLGVSRNVLWQALSTVPISRCELNHNTCIYVNFGSTKHGKSGC